MTRYAATVCACAAAIFFALGFWGGYERGLRREVSITCVTNDAGTGVVCENHEVKK